MNIQNPNHDVKNRNPAFHLATAILPFITPLNSYVQAPRPGATVLQTGDKPPVRDRAIRNTVPVFGHSEPASSSLFETVAPSRVAEPLAQKLDFSMWKSGRSPPPPGGGVPFEEVVGCAAAGVGRTAAFSTLATAAYGALRILT